MKIIRDFLPILATQIDINQLGHSEKCLHVLVEAKETIKADTLIQIALETALGKELPVVIFTQKNLGIEVAYRLLATAANLSLEKLRAGRLTGKDWELLTEGLEQLVDANIYIANCQLDGTTITQTISLVKFIHDKIGIILIDDFQLICEEINQSNPKT